jgi:hypothetical protein
MNGVREHIMERQREKEKEKERRTDFANYDCGGFLSLYLLL